MIIWPLRAFSGDAVDLDVDDVRVARAAPERRGGRRCGRRRGAHAATDGSVVDDASALVLDHVLELVAEVLDEALHGPRGRVAERADRVAFDLVRDVDEHVDVGLRALAVDDSREHAVHPARAFAARRALAARLRVIEARDAAQRLAPCTSSRP